MRLGIYFGEVIKAYPPSSPLNFNGLRYEYDVRCIVNGSVVIFRQAMMAEPLSGLDNFHEVVLRSASEDSGAGVSYTTETNKALRNPGDRVLICFANDSPKMPIIIGTLPHPTISTLANGTSTDEVLESLPALVDSVPPQLRGRYNGFQYRIDEIGQARFQHSGVAKIKIEQGYFVGKEDEPVSSLTTVDFLSKGSFRIVDNNKQAFVVDAEKKFISINNTTKAPTEILESISAIEIEEPNDEQAPIGQEIRLDQANKTLSLLSSDKFKTIVGGDSFKKVIGNQNTEIFKDENRVVYGNFIENIAKNALITVQQDLSLTVSKNISLVSQAGNSIFLDSSPGKEGVYIAHKTGAQIVLDKQGSVKIFAQDGSFLFINAATGEITMTTAAGAIITAKENVVISNSSGTEIITLRDGNVEISSGENVTISGGNVNVNSGSVSLGAGATFSAVVGEQLMTWLSSHTHPTAVGPSGPPIIPPVQTILSQSVKVKA